MKTYDLLDSLANGAEYDGESFRLPTRVVEKIRQRVKNHPLETFAGMAQHLIARGIHADHAIQATVAASAARWDGE